MAKLCLLLPSRYEPWWIASRALVVPYDVRYRGYGWNEAQQLNAHLHVRESTCRYPAPFPSWPSTTRSHSAFVIDPSTMPGRPSKSEAQPYKSVGLAPARSELVLRTQILYASFTGRPSDIDMAVTKIGQLYQSLCTYR